MDREMLSGLSQLKAAVEKKQKYFEDKKEQWNLNVKELIKDSTKIMKNYKKSVEEDIETLRGLKDAMEANMEDDWRFWRIYLYYNPERYTIQLLNMSSPSRLMQSVRETYA
jgi:glutaredoxin 2